MKTESTRITELEVSLAHLQRQYDLLNEVVTEQAILIDRASKRIEKWEQMLEGVKNSPGSEGDVTDEKPPHY